MRLGNYCPGGPSTASIAGISGAIRSPGDLSRLARRKNGSEAAVIAAVMKYDVP